MDVFDQVTKFANTASTNVNDSIRENLTSTSDQVLDVVLDTNRRIVDLAVSTADRISAQIDLEVPFADRLPTPSVAGDRYLDFVEQAVSLNRDMTQRVVEMLQAAERTDVDRATLGRGDVDDRKPRLARVVEHRLLLARLPLDEGGERGGVVDIARRRVVVAVAPADDREHGDDGGARPPLPTRPPRSVASHAATIGESCLPSCPRSGNPRIHARDFMHQRCFSRDAWYS